MPYKDKIKKAEYQKNYGKINREYFREYERNDRKQNRHRYILKYIKTRCNNPNHDSYVRYGGRGIKCLIIKEEILFLMNRDNYWQMKKPSIDRKDNDGNYTFENCRFIELGKNIKLGSQKSILQFSKNRDFIREWDCISDAEKTLKISNITGCCKGYYGVKTAGGFIWRYKN